MNKTFAELGYNVGDTVRCVDSWMNYMIDKTYKLIPDETGAPRTNSGYNGYSGTWELVPRAGSTDDADDVYLIWGDMTPEAQGALLLAEHNGAVVQEWNDGWKLWQFTDCSSRYNDTKYRVKPADPIVVAHELFGQQKSFWRGPQAESDTHKITYNVIDGVIDCASVQMMEIEK